MDHTPDKYAVRLWLQERRKHRLPLPDRGQMLRDLRSLSSERPAEARGPQAAPAPDPAALLLAPPVTAGRNSGP